MDYKTGGRPIVNKSPIKYYYIYIYRHILRKWRFKQKVPKKVHVNTASKKEKDNLLKYPSNTWINNSNSNSKKQSLL